ncbi:MAG: glycosyltransferase family 4 protein [Actinomycetota bacterium]
MGVCAIISFRLGLSDGVSIVAGSWRRALDRLGWSTYTVAAEGPVDRRIPGLAIPDPTAGPPPDPDPVALQAALADSLADADLVLVENLLSIPLNLPASRALAQVLAGRPAILHHHDPPWQRPRFAAVTELPPDDPAWRHVTINRMTEREFAERGLSAVTIYNGFDPNPEPGDRNRTRDLVGVEPDRRLFVHPVRAIARKNIPAAIGLCERLDATYWLPNGPEEGYDDELAALLDRARCPLILTPLADLDLSIGDLYAAGDLVLFPSTWEGFGNPPIEAAIHRRPVAVGTYPVADELRALGFRWLDPDDPAGIADTLDRLAGRRPDRVGPDRASTAAADLDHNRALAIQRLSTASMTRELGRLLEDLGWGT